MIQGQIQRDIKHLLVTHILCYWNCFILNEVFTIFRGHAAADTSAKDDHLNASLISPLGLVPHQVGPSGTTLYPYASV